MKPSLFKIRLRAFSLVEMLVVMGIMVLLAAVAIPAFTGSMKATALTRGGQLVADQFSLARQEAVSRGCDTQVRLLWLSADAKGCGGLQLWSPDPANLSVLRPSGLVTLLPTGIVISENGALSPLVTKAPFPRTTGSTTYCAFRFRPGGGTDLGYDSTDNYLSIIAASDADKTTPPNYSAVQVDPVNGRIRIYRP